MNNLIEAREINLEKLREEYLKYIDVADKTVETYDTAIRQFIKYLKEREIEIPTRDNVLEFKEYLKQEHSVSTVNGYLIALRNFFKFLEYNGIYKNITENVKGLKDSEIHKRNALTVEECQKVLSGAKNLREKALFMLTLSCGLRANEIVNIRVNDFIMENGKCLLYVLGKGRDSKLDYVIVPNEVLNVIKEYARQYAISDYLFVSTSMNNFNGKLTTRTIERIVNDMYERAGIKSGKIVLHSLRHTFGTIAIENGEDIRNVSKAMRHKSVTVTERYLHDLDMRNNSCSNTVIGSII